jgi:hypothetical protein
MPSHNPLTINDLHPAGAAGHKCLQQRHLQLGTIYAWSGLTILANCAITLSRLPFKPNSRLTRERHVGPREIFIPFASSFMPLSRVSWRNFSICSGLSITIILEFNGLAGLFQLRGDYEVDVAEKCHFVSPCFPRVEFGGLFGGHVVAFHI